MNTDANEHRGQDGFPVDQPMEALKKDHHFVRLLFDRYLNTQNIEVKKVAGPQIINLLEMHAAVEETVFYPRAQELDAALIDHFEDEHQAARDLMEQIKALDPGDPQCDPLFQQLSDAVMQHVQSEEQQLFPKVQQSNLDLTAIGLEMQAYEATMVTDQARASQPGMRQ